MIKEITSINNSLIKETLNILKDKKSKYFIVESKHLLQMALQSNLVIRVFTLEKLDIDDSIEQIIINKKIMDKLSNLKNSSDVICVCKKKDEFIKNDNLLIYLDYIQDPGNLGTIIRSGLAFGIKNFLLSKNCVSIYNFKTIMASQGAIFDINFKTILDTNELKEYKKTYTFLGFALSEDCKNFNEFSFNKNENYMLIFGNEGNGISEDVLNICDHKLIIPIKNIDSLNVAICFSIVAYLLNIKYLNH